MTLATLSLAPTSEADLAETVRAAAAAARPLAIEGGATRGLGHPVAGDEGERAGLVEDDAREPGGRQPVGFDRVAEAAGRPTFDGERPGRGGRGADGLGEVGLGGWRKAGGRG